MLETESPQSVVPVYMAVVLILAACLTLGKFSKRVWTIRLFTVYISSTAIYVYLLFKGLGGIAEIGARVQLDRDLKWYHVTFANFSSYRWLIILSVVGLNVGGGYFGWFFLVIRIGLLWVMGKGTGRRVVRSPWGVFDEIILENTSLLNLILGLLTFSVLMDHVASEVSKAS